jgi:tripartite-type tricarboxylate transporter receptor subunit TctC
MPAMSVGQLKVMSAIEDCRTAALGGHVGPTHAVNATLYPKLKYNFIRDIAPIASISREPLVMAVNPSVPAKAVFEFIAYAKANPCKLNMASSGIGTSVHVGGEPFKMMSGIVLNQSRRVGSEIGAIIQWPCGDP